MSKEIGDGIIAGEALRRQSLARTEIQINMMRAHLLKPDPEWTDYRKGWLYGRRYEEIETRVLEVLMDEREAD